MGVTVNRLMKILTAGRIRSLGSSYENDACTNDCVEISEGLKSNVCISDAVLWMCFEGFWRRPRPVRRAVRKKTASTHLGRIEVTTSALRILTCLLGRGEWFRLTTKLNNTQLYWIRKEMTTC